MPDFSFSRPYPVSSSLNCIVALFFYWSTVAWPLDRAGHVDDLVSAPPGEKSHFCDFH